MKIGIVGSRNIDDKMLVKNTLLELIKERDFEDVTIVSGGAKGVDTIAEQIAEEEQFDIIVLDLNGKSTTCCRHQKKYTHCKRM